MRSAGRGESFTEGNEENEGAEDGNLGGGGVHRKDTKGVKVWDVEGFEQKGTKVTKRRDKKQSTEYSVLATVS